ncbi:MAG TPA: signal peptidase I [Bryobacteraceae bacterium]|jgi:signal peptidase I|nr:signal peptidase I [Bryobacteraceae bacterium]
MAAVETKTKAQIAPVGAWRRFSDMTRDVQRGFIAEWTVTIILLLFATTTLVQAFVIPSASMESSLLIGDHVLVDKLLFAPSGPVSKRLLPYRDVRRGDIIVFRYPIDISQDYVKRAIGIPGDHIRLVNKQLMLNGHLVNEPYVQHIFPGTEPYRDNFPSAPGPSSPPPVVDMLQNHVVDGEVVVPPGYIFAMGDNRDDSADSRYWGFVPRENIVGTPVVIYWSFEAPTQDLTNPNIGIDHIVDVIAHFFTKTRWKRTFKLIRGYPLQ